MPNNYILLETIALTQSAASVTFDNLPTSGYTDLKIVISARNSAGGTSEGIFLQMNSVATGYSNRVVYGTGSAAASGNNSYGITSKTYIGEIPTSGATANTFGSIDVYIPNYRSGNQKSISSDAVTENNATAALAALNASLVTSTDAITSLTFTPFSSNFLAGSTFSLYGIAAFGTTPTLAPKATGGNIVANDGTYWYHAFTSSGNFVPQVGLTCDYLVVAGGGGAGGYGGPGGGAGGFRTTTAQSLTVQNYAVTVGAGGAGAVGQPAGASGSNSIFNAITSSGGGGTGYNAVNAGGSGGGGFVANSGAGGAGNTPSTSPSQGNNGGNAVNSAPNYGTGGGGGAGAVGGNGTSTAGGSGGIGSFTAISGGAATLLGQLSSGNYYFAGGGAGATTFGGTAGTGGIGGGGNAGAGGGNNNGVNGLLATGGGGGGGSYQSAATSSGGAGGSGVIIIRYPIN